LAYEGAPYRVLATLRSNFSVFSMTLSSPLDDSASFKAASDNQKSLIILVGSKQAAALENFVKKIPSLNANILALTKMPNRSIFALIDESARSYLVIKADSEQDFIDALEKMKISRSFDPKNPVLSY
jgi:hypothetical protein